MVVRCQLSFVVVCCCLFFVIVFVFLVVVVRCGLSVLLLFVVA